MKIKRMVLMAAVTVIAMAAFLLLTTTLASAHMVPVTPSPQAPLGATSPNSVRSPTVDWILEGRVFRGAVGDTTHPLTGVTVSAYGSNNPYPTPGTFITSTTTDAAGWYGLKVSEIYEFYHIRETDPTGYVSVGATTVSGTVRTSNWIEHVYPLTGTVLTGNKFWDRLPWLDKLVNDVPWTPDMVIQTETSDTIKIVDVVTTLPFDPLELVEQWNPAHLKLLDHQVEPAGAGSSVVTDTGILTWQVPEGNPQVFTLTKWFHVEPCTWTTTILTETLGTGAAPLEERPVTIEKKAPVLWIDSGNNPEVYAGDVATFTLSYGNSGGYENNVWIQNFFPPTATFAWSDPRASVVAPDRSWARWNVGDLAMNGSGDIIVGVAITETVPPSTTIEIWDRIYDHVNQEWASTVITFHVQGAPVVGWNKWVNGDRWYPELVVPTQTSDTIEVVDVVNSADPFELIESWHPGELALLDLQFTAGQVVTGDGVLVWNVPGAAGVVTLTKRFHVEPCTWDMTILEERLFVGGAAEPLVRFVPVQKLLPELWINSEYQPDVFVGEPVTFTLHYGNDGGREFGAWIRNEFPDIAPFIGSVPPPTDQDPNGLWAVWDVEPLETNQAGSITVTVGIAPHLPPSTTIHIWDGIFNHAGELVGEIPTVFHVPFPPVTFPEGNWPWYAQEEISVDPEPPIAGYPTQLCAEVVNNDLTKPHTVTLEFSVANFGIGVPFTPVGATDVVVPPGGMAKGCVVWVPPTPDHWCIQVRLMGPRFPYMISQRNVDVDEPLVPGVPHSRSFPVGNPFGHAVTISLGLIPHLPNWGLALSQDVLPGVAPGTARMVTLTVTPPDGLPPDGHPIVDVEAFAEDKLIGGFRKIFRPPVILHRFPDPPYAEREISVHPYPPLAGEPTEVCVELYNPTSVPQTVTVQFSWANFGVGLPFTPIHGPRDVHLPPRSIVNECVQWVPPTSGHVCLQVEMHMDGYPMQRSQRNLDVDEPLLPGVSDTRPFSVGNPFNYSVTATLELIHRLPDWMIELSEYTLPNMGPNEQRVVSLTVKPPLGRPLPDDNTPIVDVEVYAEDQLIGGFRKVFRPPIPLHPFPDPPYAEREISVHPYPPLASEPTEVCVELRNPTPYPHTVEVQFSWAHFGIGIPFTPINGRRSVHLPPYSVVNECVQWIPPVTGHVCLQVELFMDNYPPQRSQRNIDIDEPLVPGQPHTRPFPVGNPYEHAVTITLGLIPHLPDWELDLSADVLPNVGPGEQRVVSLTVLPPPGLPLPDDDTIIVDVEAYAEDKLIGGFRKIHRPPIPLHPFPDPPYAEREISVQPYPPLAGEPTEVCVELRNPTPYPHTVEAQFSWAHFGIGLPFTPINGLREVHLPPYSIVNECVYWIPPVSGHVCLQVELFQPGYPPQRSQRNIDVDEPLRPGNPHERLFPVGNPFDRPVTITLGLIPHLPDWGLELSEDVLPDVPPGEVRQVSLTVIPPPDRPLPPDGEVIVDVEAFVEGELIGGFRKIFRPPVPIHRPKDPVYAESEIFVHPYPPRAHEPTELAVEIRNPSDVSQTITVTFSVAPFGIGLPFVPVNVPMTVTVPAHGMVRPGTMWMPRREGLWCIQVEIEIPGHDEPFWSRLNLDVGEPLKPNTPHSRPFPVGSWPYTEPVTITLGLVPHFPDWGLELSEEVLTNVLPGPEGVRMVELTVTPPDDLPADGDPIVDVEAFVNGELLGGFRKIFRPPVPIHRPKDPIYAESEIGVDPYPVLPGQRTELSVEVFNPTDDDHIVTATFSIAPFGIGLPFSTTRIMPNPIRIFVPAHGAARGHVVWEPPPGIHGKFCVMVELELPGHEKIWSRRNIDVGEPLRPGKPHSLTFTVGRWPYTSPVTVTLGLINHRDDFDTDLSADSFFDVFYDIVVDDPVTVTLTVTPSANARLGTGEPIVDVEAYVDGELLGGFRKLDIPPIPLHKPHEKNYAETELGIIPDPPQLGQPAQIGAVMQNNGSVTSTITLEFGYARFGVGIPFTTTGMVPYTRSMELGPMMTDTAWVTWTPTFSGSHCVIVKMIDPDGNYEDIVSQRNVRVVEERPPCGQTKVFTFTMYNDSPFTVTVDLGLVTFDVPESWEVTTVPSGTMEIGPFSEGVVQVIVRIPCPYTWRAMRVMRAMRVSQEESGGVPTINVEGYIDGELVGGIELQFPAGVEADVPPSRVVIGGPTVGTAGTAYTFTATVDPISTTIPITYVWQASGTSGVTMTADVPSHTVSFAWPTTGTKTITVTATNAVGSVTDTHTITISECTEVTSVDLSVVTVSPIYTGIEVQFEANIAPDDAGKPYNYLITVDGTPGTAGLFSSADLLVFTRTFATTGTHTVEIAVWNCAMTVPEAVTDTVQVDVIASQQYKIYLPLVLRNQ